MSNLLSQASLVMIPSGYKEDVVYSAIPTDGSGDLSFTRASNGTRVNSAGLVEVVPWNLLSDTDTFSSWNLEGGTLTSGQTDPNGGSTAYKYVQVPGGGLYSGSGGVTADVKCAQVWIKSVSGGSITCNIGDGAAGFGTLNVTGTWQLFTAPYTANSRIAIYLYSISNASGIYVWHPQVNIGSTAKPYFPTTDRLNVPRLTYQNGGGGCPSLLLEKQSTNLVSYSEDFTNAVYTKVEVTASTNATTSPDGTVNGNSIFETTVSSTHESWQRASMTAGQLYTQSCFLKANGRNRVIMQIFDNATQYASAIYDLSTGVVVSSSGTATIQSMGNGWYRCTITGTSPATGLGYCVLGLCENTYTNSSVMPTYVGDTAKGVYWWGFQVENSSYPTSYIPTTSSSATRVADACFKTGIGSLFGTNQGTFFIDCLYLNSNIPDYLFDVTDSSNVQRFLMYSQNGGDVYVLYNSADGGFASYTFTKGQRYKIAVKYNSTATYWYINGSLIATGVYAFGYQMSQIYLGQRFSQTDQTQMQVNQTIVFPTALSGTDLIALTTI